MNIRSFVEAELEDILSIYNRARAKEECFADVNATLQALEQLIAGESVFVALSQKLSLSQKPSGEKIIGFVSVWSAQKFVHHLYVDPDYQGKGVATALVRQCVDEFGYPLSLKCLVTNTAACKYYEASGWKNAGLSGGTDGDAILYRLQLLAD